jgi:flavin reductase (DIM6/NTAB) family NADH-FMN oxidoreductase RutF
MIADELLDLAHLAATPPGKAVGTGGELTGAFRGAMRRLACSVSIVTALRKESWYGMTMTAVTSVSMDPPALLICVNQSTRLHGVLACAAGRFCVNLLRSGHEEVASAFGGRVGPSERFRIGDWRCNDDAPYLADAQSNVFCRVSAAIPYGSHTIFIGAVHHVCIEGVVSPLMYADGRYVPFASAA